jgi:hypothetical protein
MMEMLVWSVRGPSLFFDLLSVGFWAAKKRKKLARNLDTVTPITAVVLPSGGSLVGGIR